MSEVSEEEGVEGQASEDEQETPQRKRRSLFQFVGSPASSEEEEEIITIDASNTLQDDDQDVAPDHPLEPEVIIRQPPQQKTPERPKKVPSENRRPKRTPRHQPPRPEPSSPSSKKGKNKTEGKGSAAPSSTPPWPSPDKDKQDTPEPPAYVLRIFEELKTMQERISGLETNQFRGFSPKKANQGQQTSPLPSEDPQPSTSTSNQNSSERPRPTASVAIADPLTGGSAMATDGVGLGLSLDF